MFLKFWFGHPKCHFRDAKNGSNWAIHKTSCDSTTTFIFIMFRILILEMGKCDFFMTICNLAQKRRFCSKLANTLLRKYFDGSFALTEILPTPCYPTKNQIFRLKLCELNNTHRSTEKYEDRRKTCKLGMSSVCSLRYFGKPILFLFKVLIHKKTSWRICVFWIPCPSVYVIQPSQTRSFAWLKQD